MQRSHFDKRDGDVDEPIVEFQQPSPRVNLDVAHKAKTVHWQKRTVASSEVYPYFSKLKMTQ